MNTRINKYPFFLWITKEKNFQVFKNTSTGTLKIVDEQLGESEIKKVPEWQIFLIKYLPLILFSFLFYTPQNKNEILPFLGAFIFAIFLSFIYLKMSLTIVKFTVGAIALVNIFLVFYFTNYAVVLDVALTFFVEILFFIAIFVDIFIYKAYTNWYFISDFSQDFSINLSKKKERKFLFIKFTSGFNIGRKINIRGYFLRGIQK